MKMQTIINVYHALYGVFVGSFAGKEQLIATPVKLLLAYFGSAALCFPSLFIFSVLRGSKRSFGEIFSSYAIFLAMSTFLLLGFAPVAWLFSISTESLPAAGGVHVAVWLATVLIARRVLRELVFEPGRSFEAGSLIRIWCFLFLITSFQMATTLRPIVDTERAEFLYARRFFLTHWGSCAFQRYDQQICEEKLVGESK
jgi:hypothetical protein